MMKRFGVTIITLVVFIFSFQTLLAAPPSNDNFADAEQIDRYDYMQQYEHVTATTEIGENPCASDHSLWYKFTLTEPNKIAIGAADNEDHTIVRVGLYSNESVLTLLDCDDGVGDADENGFELPDIDIRTSLGAGTYYIQVGSVTGNGFVIRFEIVPENDDAADAIDISQPFGYMLSPSWSATSEPGESSCASGRSVWYKFTLPENMRIQVFANAASNLVENFSALVGIYRADDLQTPVVCEQNQPDFPDVFFKKRLNAGEYYLQFGSNSVKQFYLLLLYREPENDNFSDALKLTEEGGFAAAALATVETGDDMYGSLTCGGRLYHTVWYKFKLKQPTVVDLLFQGDLLINYDGSAPRNLYYIDLWQKSGSGKIPLACDNVDVGEIRRELAPGTYYVRLASKSKLHKTLPSHYSLGVTFEPPGLPAIYDQPDYVYIRSGLPVVLSVAAHSSTPMNYQWYKSFNSGDISDPVEGATDPVLVIPSASSANYWVRITNAVGSRDSERGSVSTTASISRGERVQNGGFEDGATGWTLTNPTNDKVVCGNITKPPRGNGSPCAFLFKGSAGENTILKQSYTLSSSTDFLDFSFWMKNTAGAGKLQVRVTVKYSDIADQVVKLKYRPQNAYTRLSSFVQLQSNSPQSAEVRFIHSSQADKTFIDDVSVVTVNASLTRDGTETLPPPPAPDGFRNNN